MADGQQAFGWRAASTTSALRPGEIVVDLFAGGGGASEALLQALGVAAFLINYYGNGQAVDLTEPLDTVTTRDRLALVTVHVQGVPYVIVDIGLRMLAPRELFKAQGFPHDYIIDRTADGRPLTKTQQVRMVGNSVSPPPLKAIAAANLASVADQRAEAYARALPW